MAESWRHRKTLILGRSDMIGLLTPGGVRRLRRARLPHARPRPRVHGAEGPHRARPLPGRVGGDAVLDRGARGGGLQVGLDPRGQREVRAAGRLLDPRLHAPRDRLPARDLRRLAPHADAHGRVGRRLGEVAGAQGLEGARDPRHRQRRQGDARHLRRRLRRGTRCASGAGRRSRSTASWPRSSRPTRTSSSRARPRRRGGRARRRRRRHRHARARLARRRRLGRARRAHRRARRRPRGRAGARPADPAAGAGLRRRHPPVPRGRRDQRRRCARG